jgi:predicted DCC family thiol-disulfide oxidoreductase YuxK
VSRQNFLSDDFSIDRNFRKKTMNADYPLTLYYDANCPVCALEMDHLRARNDAGKLRFVDIAAPGFDSPLPGVTLAQLDAEIHATRPDGTVLRGVEVLRLAYAAVGLGWVLRPTAWAPLRPLVDVGYRLFARHRRRISRAAAPLIDAIRAARAHEVEKRMRKCSGGTCELPRRR